MRPARRADIKTIWKATLQTVWDDIPDNDRTRLDRGTWEAYFRKKIEAYVEGDRTEKWIAEGPDGAFLGYLILGEGGFLTPESHAFIYDVWVAPDRRGAGIGRSLVEWACEWARKRGHRKIKLEVAEANVRARHVYESGGFQTERRYMARALA
jgi:ribosomal protein S18 acetylase RimI-like enzyme